MSAPRNDGDPPVDAIDLHIYSGGALLAVGFGLIAPAYGVIAAAFFLIWMGARSS